MNVADADALSARVPICRFVFAKSEQGQKMRNVDCVVAEHFVGKPAHAAPAHECGFEQIERVEPWECDAKHSQSMRAQLAVAVVRAGIFQQVVLV